MTEWCTTTSIVQTTYGSCDTTSDNIYNYNIGLVPALAIRSNHLLICYLVYTRRPIWIACLIVWRKFHLTSSCKYHSSSDPSPAIAHALILYNDERTLIHLAHSHYRFVKPYWHATPFRLFIWTVIKEWHMRQPGHLPYQKVDRIVLHQLQRTRQQHTYSCQLDTRSLNSLFGSAWRQTFTASRNSSILAPGFGSYYLIF